MSRVRRALAKLGYGLLVLWGVLSLLFGLFQLLGDPARSMAGQRTDAETLAAIRVEMGLDQPLAVQYLAYWNRLLPVGYVTDATGYQLFAIGAGHLALKAPNLGRSFYNKRSVAALYLERLPATAMLGLGSLALAVLIGVGLGSYAAQRVGTWQDNLVAFLSMMGMSAPSFVVAVVLVFVLAIVGFSVTGLPVAGYVWQPDYQGNGAYWSGRYLVLPLVTLAIRPTAILFQLTRDSLLNVEREAYVRTAQAKGLPSWRVFRRHRLPNALNPVITAISGWFASLLAGTFFVEYIFDWPGIGQLTLNALFQNDFPVLLGSATATAVLFLCVNALTDGVQAAVDPRIRLGQP